MLKDIQKAQSATPADRALQNAIAANSIDNLAKNHANAGALDTHFSVETKKQSITDQKQSGRCWMFSGMNVLRGDFNLRTDSLTVEFSQAYLFFWDQLEKANLMLQGVIDTAKKPIDDQRVQFFFHYPMGDGGTFCGVADLADKYGLVPKEVMPETFSSDNTSRATRLIASKLREYGLQLRDMVQKGKKAPTSRKPRPACWHKSTTCCSTPSANRPQSSPTPSATRREKPLASRASTPPVRSTRKWWASRSTAPSSW